MAVDEQHDERRRGRKRERVATVVMALFPLLVAGGFLAPGWVRILAVAQEISDGEREPIVDRIGPFARRPLPVAREFFGGGMPDLLDLNQLFLTGSAIDPSLARFAGFPRGQSDGIVIDSVGRAAPTVAFKDILTDPGNQVASTKLNPDEFLPLCGTLPMGNCVRFDDLTGIKADGSNPIPEPATGALLGLGLAGLAARRRRATASR